MKTFLLLAAGLGPMITGGVCRVCERAVSSMVHLNPELLSAEEALSARVPLARRPFQTHGKRIRAKARDVCPAQWTHSQVSLTLFSEEFFPWLGARRDRASRCLTSRSICQGGHSHPSTRSTGR